MTNFKLNGAHEWFKAAEEMTVNLLPDFITELTQKYKKDVDYRCIPEFPHIICAIALAGANAAMKVFTRKLSPEQRQKVLVHFIKEWVPEYKKAPFRLIDYSWMLYPGAEFVYNTIEPVAWKWVQTQALNNLRWNEEEKKAGKPSAPDKTVDHWKAIASGKVPFGLKIRGG